MLNAVNNVLFPHCLDGPLDQHFVAILYKAGKLPSTQLLELTLHNGEGELDRVPLWRIRYVVTPSEV